MQHLIEQPKQELQQVKELVELINIEWMTLPNAQPMDESLYEESRLMPEQSEPELEDGHTKPKEAEQAGTYRHQKALDWALGAVPWNGNLSTLVFVGRHSCVLYVSYR